MFNKIVTYVKEARGTQKVTWPDRDEVTSFTMVVIVSVVIVSLFLWFVDTALMSLIQLVIG